MNLIIKLPKGVNSDGVLFSIPYNLNFDLEKLDGVFVVKDDSITLYESDKIVGNYKLSDFEEIVCEQLVGASMLIGKNGDDVTCICAFSQEHFLEFAEFAKIIGHYKRTGEMVESSTDDVVKCPKCGVPLEGTSCPFCAKKSKLFIRLVKRIGKYKGLFFLAVLCTILTELCWLIPPVITKTIVDDYITPKNADFKGFILLAIILVVLNIVAWLLENINLRASFRVALGVGQTLRHDVFEKAQRLSMSSISKRTAGEMINRISGDAINLQEFITSYGKDSIVKAFSLIFLSVALIVLNPTFSLFVLLPVLLIMLITTRLFNVMRSRYGRTWRMSTRHSSLLHDILNGIRVVKSFGNEKREAEKYRIASENLAKASTNAEIVWYTTVHPAWFLRSIGTFLVLYFGSNMILADSLTLGELIQYTAYTDMMYGALEWMIHIPRMLSNASVSASRVFEILDEKEAVADCENAANLTLRARLSLTMFTLATRSTTLF